MSILNPIHLFDQADKLIQVPFSGPPRQVDLRRAISNAYYAVFHLVLTALTDEFIGAAHRGTNRYTLVHRSVNHKTIKELCSVALKTKPPAKYAPFVPIGGFGKDLRQFANGFLDLQDKRHRADYDVGVRYLTLDARVAIASGRSAMTSFKAAALDERRIFLTLLLCPPR